MNQITIKCEWSTTTAKETAKGVVISGRSQIQGHTTRRSVLYYGAKIPTELAGDYDTREGVSEKADEAFRCIALIADQNRKQRVIQTGYKVR